jgi:hypothetical protein
MFLPSPISSGVSVVAFRGDIEVSSSLLEGNGDERSEGSFVSSLLLRDERPLIDSAQEKMLLCSRGLIKLISPAAASGN